MIHPYAETAERTKRTAARMGNSPICFRSDYLIFADFTEDQPL